MDQLSTTDLGLQCESVDLSQLAERFGTPLYFYSWSAIASRFDRYTQSFGAHAHQICYAVKAASNIAILHRLAKLGAGFDIVSGGELERVLAAGCPAERIIFSGVGKSAAEITQALQAQIGCFNVESAAELELINDLALKLGTIAPIALRVNPDIAIDSHPYLCTGKGSDKFGILLKDCLALYERASQLPAVSPVGVDCHIGSQMLQLDAFEQACQQVADFTRLLLSKNIPIHHVDVGGGLGIPYQPNMNSPSIESFVQIALKTFAPLALKILVEPGRSLIGPAGGLLTRVIRLKHSSEKNFAIVDAAMNDLLRPALYNAHHHIQLVNPTAEPEQIWDIVGPVCESGDFLARDRPLALSCDSLLLLEDTGAYGFAMSGEYNSRPRPVEVLIEKEHALCIRPRQTPADLFAQECIL